MDEFEFDDANLNVSESDLQEMDKAFLKTLENKEGDSQANQSQDGFAFFFLVVLLLLFVFFLCMSSLAITRAWRNNRNLKSIGYL